MLLMVSVQNLPEAIEALHGGADIVDVKNLQEALVGSAHPLTVKAVRDAIPAERHASVTLGVVPNQAGTVAMAVYAAGILNATSVKVGFMTTEYDQAVETLLECREALNGFETKLIGSLFADNPLYGGLEADHTVDLAKAGQCDGWLIDTLTKDGRNLFDFMPELQLREMVLEGKETGMSTALSGHLRMSDVDELARINPDIVGVRGAVCRKGDRSSDVHRDAVGEFRRQLDLRETGKISVREARIMAGNGAGVLSPNGWIIIDGTGKTCAGILAALNAQIELDADSFIEVIIPDVLNAYDVVVWAEERSHDVLTQRKDESGTTRMLIKP
jgi:uncharacterized protein (UPF0264 family)/TusA-related sulfurtransferase